MIRRSFLKQLAALPFVATVAPASTTNTEKLEILMKSAWGSDDPTKVGFRFLHADALSDAGHNVQIFLLGEAVSLMRKSVANAVVPVGWPPLADVLGKIVAKKNTNLRLRRVLAGQGDNGNRSGRVWSKIRQSQNLRFNG